MLVEMIEPIDMATRNMYSSECYVSQIDLPIEIIIYIMEFLPLADRISASQVCRLWYDASRDFSLHTREVLLLQENLARPLRVLENTCGTFLHFVFKEVDLGGKITEFWEKFCPQMLSLSIHSCDVSERTFVEILSRCSNLESLSVYGCRELLMSGRVLEVESDIVLLKKTLIKLRELSLSANRYLSDALFNRFMAIAPNLESLSLSQCQISFHLGLYKKFYPACTLQSGDILASESVLTFYNIQKYISTHANTLHTLEFSHTLIDNAALSHLSVIPGLKLRTLRLQACDQLTNAGILDLTTHQHTLTTLCVNECSRLTDHSLLAICHHLSNLSVLNVRSCRAITDIGVSELFRLPLTELNLAQCVLVTGAGVQKGLCSHVSHRFRRLDLLALPLDEETVCRLAQSLPGLTHLNLGWCFNGVTDRSMQAICKHQIWLEHLDLTDCNKLTDAGLTGIKMVDSISDQNIGPSHRVAPPSQTFNSSDEDDPLHKISLRSRAEKEIVEDAKRKIAVSQRCEDQTQGSEMSGDSLARLRGLRHLAISGCNRITDVSLKFAFRFPGLQYLGLSRCQQVTHMGLSYLSEHNPSVQTLLMSHCYNITDEGVLCCVKGLNRLKRLEVQGCNHLTDKSLKAIGMYCRALRYLDVSHCSGMTMEGVDSLETSLPALHTLLRHGHVARLRCGSTEDVKVPPPPPSSGFKFLMRLADCCAREPTDWRAQQPEVETIRIPANLVLGCKHEWVKRTHLEQEE